jgi:hypothetical protein
LTGYQEEADWECPYMGRGHMQGGLLCYPCLVKEMEDWKVRGWLFPTE